MARTVLDSPLLVLDDIHRSRITQTEPSVAVIFNSSTKFSILTGLTEIFKDNRDTAKLIIFLCWRLWKARNSLVFQENVWQTQQIVICDVKHLMWKI